MKIRLAIIGAVLIGSQPSYAQETAAADELIPAEDFRISSVLFGCPGPGARSLGMQYNDNSRYLNYTNIGEDVSFHSNDAKKTIRYVEDSSGSTWYISASGPALSEEGPLGYDFTIELIMKKPTSAGLTADWSVRAGEFSGHEKNCRPLRIPGPVAEDSK